MPQPFLVTGVPSVPDHVPHHLPPQQSTQVQPVAAQRSWGNEAVASLQLAVLLGLFWTGLFGDRAPLFGTSAVALTVVASRLVAPLPLIRLSPVGLVGFLAHFFVQSFLGAIDVARRALNWRVSLTRGVWPYTMRIPSGQGRALFVGCIGLLPGTVGCATRGDRLWVHSIAGDPRRQLTILEQRVARLYGITLSGGVE